MLHNEVFHSLYRSPNIFRVIKSKSNKHNSVQLVWVPRHEGILGNERTDKLAKKGANTILCYMVVKQSLLH